MPSVVLGPMNTLTIAAASGVYRLKPASGYACTVDLMNAGGGSLFIRADADPAVSSAQSLLLPANTALNGFPIDGNTGLGVIASADTTLSVRVR